LQGVALWLASIFDRLQAAADQAKAEADKVSPGSADAWHAAISERIAAIRAEADPATAVRVALEEVIASLRSGRSFIRHHPTDLAG
jgi:hypothetical protein